MADIPAHLLRSDAIAVQHPHCGQPVAWLANGKIADATPIATLVNAHIATHLKVAGCPVEPGSPLWNKTAERLHATTKRTDETGTEYKVRPLPKLVGEASSTNGKTEITALFNDGCLATWHHETMDRRRRPRPPQRTPRT